MLNSIVPATIVIDKPEIGMTSTKSSVSCIEYERDGYKDSDCGGYPDNRSEIVNTVDAAQTCACTVWPCYHSGPEYGLDDFYDSSFDDGYDYLDWSQEDQY
jgi:hypothetical protein